MKIWRTRIYSQQDGLLLHWSASRRAAEQHVRETELKDEDPLVEHDRVDFPLTRAGLIKWLNIHFTSDNG